MNTKLLFLSFLLLFPFLMTAQTVDEKQSKTVAKNFYFERINIDQSVKYDEIELRLSKTYVESDLVIFRVFEPISRPGFIMVSTNESVVPILGYSLTNKYLINQELPPNFKEWIESYAGQIKSLENTGNNKNDLWDIYSVKPDLNNLKGIKDVSPLLSTTWNQGCGYNALCPIDASGPCGHVWAGCVATAMAQVMKFHEHPSTGEGTHSYTHYTYGEQFADFESAVYDWSIMTNGSGNAEVAELMYHCGVSVNMNYSPSGSGAYSSNVVAAWKEYFKYSPNLLLSSKSMYTDENWAGLLRAEIDAGRPLYYHGYGSGGHAFNIDGYQGADYFHLNWGWGGSYNGYFYLNDLTPGGYTFTNGQGTIIGSVDRDLYPGIDCSSPVVLSCNIPYSGTTTTSENIVNKYGSCYYHSTGKEVVHQITTSFPGRIRASLSDLNENDLDVFILSHCDQDSLLAYADSSCFADNTEPGTYYIVADGKYAHEGDYTLTVTCPTVEPDLIISDHIIAPMYIEAGGIGNLSFKVSNIGNTSAGTSKVNIYYSEDNLHDGSDIFLDQIDVIALEAGDEASYVQNVNIPISALEGVAYIIFKADADNEITESDEIHNIEFAAFNVPAEGLMDCSSSVSLSSGVWYTGNTETQGTADLDMYSCGLYPEKEVIHSITASHNGVATVEFSEKVPGRLILMPLTACNENTCTMNFGIWNPEDTLIHESMNVFAGITYYFVIDAEEGISGEYSLKITMPDACPDPYISYWGEIDLCDSDGGASLYTDWAYTDIQWYKDELPIEGQTWSNLWATEAGDYKVEVTENGCSSFSETIHVSINPEPSHAIISALGDTVFCEGDDVTLELNTGTGYTVQWMRNGNFIEGETALNYIANESGMYTAEVTNISCSINSDPIEITADPVTANIGEISRVNSFGLISHFACDINDNFDLSGNGNDYFYSGWDFPEDRNGIWAKSHYYNGKWEQTTTTNSFDNPNVLSISLWFKTSTNSGGRLIGLGNDQWGISTSSDRMIYMDDSGKLYFGLWSGAAETISTAESYNDNNWHLVTATLSFDGMKLYVDGSLKDENSLLTAGADYIGWWKLAYDHIDPSFPNIPSSLYYQGIIDDVRIYERELLAGEIAYLYEESQMFDAYVEQSSFCEDTETNIILINTEAFIEYQLRDDSDNSLVGLPITGNTEMINLPTGTISENTTFNVLATNPFTGCSFELDGLFSIAINELPTAELTGGGTICEGETATITIELTGTAPWNISYTDGTNSFNESTSEDPYMFAVSENGSYELTALSDANCTGNDLNGEALVSVNELPTAFISGDAELCDGETTDITIDLTGTAAWNISYTDGTNTFNESTSEDPYVFSVSENGSYELTALTDANCSGIDLTGEAIVVVNGLPIINLGDDVYINTDESVTLDAGPDFISYLWNDGSTEQSLILFGSELGIGSFEYYVLVEDFNTCENSDTIIINVEQGTDIAYNNMYLEVYPNPTNGMIVLISNSEIEMITIYNEFGKEIRRITDSVYQYEINLNDQADGIYFIQIYTDKGVTYKKIILQK